TPALPAPLTCGVEPRLPPASPRPRRWPVGAEVVAPGVTSFRVWAQKRRRVEVVLEGPAGGSLPLAGGGDGYFCGTAGVGAGTRYRFRRDGEETLYPDPAARFQPDGPFGPSEVIDPRAFRWTDATWPGVAPAGRVLYELHVGAFTPEGTWAAAAAQLP